MSDLKEFQTGAAGDSFTVGGAFAANGGATLGDASGDALTINSSAVSIPNGLNFDSNTLVVDAANNRVGIGTSSPLQKLGVEGAGDTRIDVRSTDANPVSLQLRTSHTAPNNNNWSITAGSGGTRNLVFTDNLNAERMRIDSSGNVGIGTSSPSSYNASARNLVIANSSGGAGMTIRCSDGNAANIVFSNAEDTGVDGLIQYLTNSNYMRFDTAGSERMRLDSSGALLVGKTAIGIGTAGFEARASGLVAATRSGDIPFSVNRLTNDGNLVEFYQDSNLEGNISVSGTTVSYNGGHLARWSQLLDNSKDESLLKGTVLSNLDEMCVWEKDGVVAENEQLNKMKVSDVEGDTNVAVTGDMIIRIAEGVTVNRGDLLMSAGDGTAKPQGDDIVRSKTIAKVTSTNITCTYADGSYCVPCVLMAC